MLFWGAIMLWPRGDGYVAMLQSLKKVQQWLEIDDVYNVKATSSDHHDCLINAIRSELPNGIFK